jgi:SnoaL-like protein
VPHPFREAVEAQDLQGMVDALAPDVVFNSPVAFRPFVGREAVAGVLGAVFETFEDFEYTDELESPDGTLALVFQARVGDKTVQGVDLLRLDGDGRIEDFTVMVRPASALMALGEAMAPKVQGLAKGE